MSTPTVFVWRPFTIPECERSVSDAIEIGYRGINTAQAYYIEGYAVEYDYIAAEVFSEIP